MAVIEHLENLNCVQDMASSVVRFSHYYSSKTSLKPGRIQGSISINSIPSSSRQLMLKANSQKH